jgi:adenylylsulfate kinase
MSWAIWITGLPGSGKSALARAAAAELRDLGEPVRVLELDEIRKTLTPQPRYTDAERDVVYRALGYMAMHLVEAGVPVIIDATAHRRVWRDLARATIPRFAEVQVVCPPEVCRERERTRTIGHAPAGIYARAGRPGATVPGVDVPYEPALAPELVIDSVSEPVADAAARIVELARRLAFEPPPAPARSTGWAIWITGRPGSGKTTLAERVAEALALRDVRVRVLDLAAARRLLLPDRRGSEAEQEIVHRALAYTAKLLTEAGVAVILDATAPRRAWRQAARELIPCFAEVQLVCPVEVCVERERAVRWRLGGESPAEDRGSAPAPDLVLDYEESPHPELVLRTDVQDPWTTAQQVLFLVQRLRRALTLSIESP